MTFARKLLTDLEGLQPAVTRQRIELASRFFERADRAAITPQERAQYLFARASLSEIQKNPHEQVALYQSVLLDPTLATEQISDAGGAATAGTLAERRIADVLRQVGRAPYAKFEQQAVADFAAAASGADDDGNIAPLMRIIEQYPNAEVVADVLAEAAARLESADRPLEAAQAWRRLLARAPEPRIRLIAHEAIARNGLLSPTGGELAIAQLRQALQINPDATLTRPLRLSDGRSVAPGRSLREAIDLLRADARALAEARLPDFNLIVLTRENREQALGIPPFGPLDDLPRVENVRTLLPAMPDARRLDRAIAWDGQALLIINATDGSVAHRVPAPDWFVEDAAGSAWRDDHVIAFCRTGLLAIDTSDGSITWTKRLKTLSAIDQLGENLASLETDDFSNETVTDERAMQIRRVRVRQMAIRQNAVRARGGGEDEVRHVRLLSDAVIVNTSNGRLASLALDTGEPRWQFAIGDRNADRLETTEDFTALLVRDELMTNLVVLRSDDGTLRFRRALGRENGVGIANFALSLDGTLVYLTADRLIGVDLFGDPSRPAFQTDRSANEPNLFMNSTEPEQLVISDGRILAVIFGQQNQQAVRAFSLADGKPVRYRDPKTGNETIARFPLDAAGERISIRAIGNRMYLVGQRPMVSFD
ncbi:MAG TPA: PQQ-binding-like beta-propeller repeat protein, partial [Tepidisphaeraceae bacterium]|nr:PQQ-binding-like beta-propeller repeat protein [Tepidisphaeraceae bacterium]